MLRLWWELHREHIPVGRCTVERLMRRLGLRGVRRGGYKVVTTVPDSSQDRPGDLVDRDFRACAPNRLWVVDFTYVATWAGTVYTALVIDAFSRMILGWRTAGHHRMTLVLDALVMAVAARRREGVTVAGAIHHSDAGSEYLAIRYGRELTAAGMTPSVGSVGDSYDNALAESMIGLYKTEVIAHQGLWRDLAQVETATATWVGWFNQQRLFWPIGRRPPAEYERAYYAGELDPAAPAPGRKAPGKSTRKTKKTT
jgi:putative transposase